MKIGQLSQRSGVPATALRYYEKVGLLERPGRTPSGYRAYDRSALTRVAFIRAAQAVGLSLAQIRDVISIRDGGTAPCGHVVELIERRRSEVRERIEELRRLEQELDRVGARAKRVDPADCGPSGICAVIPIDEGRGRVLRSRQMGDGA